VVLTRVVLVLIVSTQPRGLDTRPLGGDPAQAREVAEQLIELTAATRADAKSKVIDGLMRGRGRE